MLKKGSKIIVVKNVWHLMSRTSLQWREGTVDSVNGENYKIRFSKGTLRGLSCEPVLDIHMTELIPIELFESYKSGISKLSDKERIALDDKYCLC